MEDIKYWWCPSCQDNVHVLIGYESGVFCRECGTSTIVPKNIADPIFIDEDPEEEDEGVSSEM